MIQETLLIVALNVLRVCYGHQLRLKHIRNDTNVAWQGLLASARVAVHAASKTRASKRSANELEGLRSNNALLQEERANLLRLQAVLIQQLSRLTDQTNDEVNVLPSARSMPGHHSSAHNKQNH